MGWVSAGAVTQRRFVSFIQRGWVEVYGLLKVKVKPAATAENRYQFYLSTFSERILERRVSKVLQVVIRLYYNLKDFFYCLSIGPPLPDFKKGRLIV